MRYLTARAASARILSWGGGVQSMALTVLQAQGRLRNPFDYFVFANVGADSENPATLAYVDEVAKPYMLKHSVPFVEVAKTVRGKPESLLAYIYRTPKSVPIPMYFTVSGLGRRSCTQDFKVRAVDKWVRTQGFQYVTMGLGISLDEYHRARDTQWHDKGGGDTYGFLKRREYPLIDLHMRRNDCKQVVRDAGLPPAPKSSCWFCPFTKHNEWVEMKRERPEMFAQAVALEEKINSKSDFRGQYASLHISRKPIANAVGNQLPMFPEWEMDNCESGYCFV
jgi:hypothetical protein